MKAKILLYLFCSIVLFTGGMISYKDNLLPRQFLHKLKTNLISNKESFKFELSKEKQLKKSPHPKIRILPYAKGTPLFSDRSYEDTIGSELLEFSYVVQLPRHFDGNITMIASEKIIIYRLLSHNNDNQVFSDWNQTKIPVLVNGISAKHSYVVSKAFSAGNIQLFSGGPICSSPILVKQAKDHKIVCPFIIR